MLTESPDILTPLLINLNNKMETVNTNEKGLIEQQKLETLIKQVEVYQTKKASLEKELEDVRRFENIYAKELKSIQTKLHKTADGKVIHLSNMEDSHLINTAKMFYAKFGEKRTSPTMKYVDEIKRRGLVDTYLVATKQKQKLTAEEIEQLESVEDEFTPYDDMDW